MVIMDDQWPRALLRAALLDAGYDAVGARSVSEALAQTPADPERGAVRLVIIDRPVLAREDTPLADLLGAHRNPVTLLLAPAGESAPPGPWSQIIHRPVSIGDMVRVIRSLLPLTSTGSGSIE